MTSVLYIFAAQVFPMSILACLGADAEAIRDVFLTRLAATTEDVQLKVVIVSFLSICVETQPGLVEIFLNLTPDTAKKVRNVKVHTVRYYDTAGIRKKYYNIQTIELSSINF